MHGYIDSALDGIVMVGLSHQTAPIAVREQFYFSPSEREIVLEKLKNNPAVVEALVLSTCNRTEVYANAIQDVREFLTQLLFDMKGIAFDPQWKKYFRTFRGEDACRHLFRVSAGLESLVLGEEQILGQVKDASEFSRQRGMMRKTFNILSNLAVRAGKMARSQTGINRGGSSISWAAVNTAQKALGTLEGKSALIIGTGKMGELALNYLRKKGLRQLYVMNRSREKAEMLARRVNGVVASSWEIAEVLKKVDVCICSAGATHFLVERDLVETMMRARTGGKMVFIDISMPRNIDPAVSEFPGVVLFAVDDLNQAVEDNASERLRAVGAVEEITEHKLAELYRKLATGPRREQHSFCEQLIFGSQELSVPAGIRVN